MIAELIPLSIEESDALRDTLSSKGFDVLRKVLESHRDERSLEATALQLSGLHNQRGADKEPNNQMKAASAAFAHAARIDSAIQQLTWIRGDLSTHKKLQVL